MMSKPKHSLLYTVLFFILISIIFQCKSDASDDRKHKIFMLAAIISSNKKNITTKPTVVIQTGNAIVSTIANSDKIGNPFGMTINNAGTLFLADTIRNRILTLTASGVVTTLAGPTLGPPGYVDGKGSGARFKDPTGIVMDLNGNLFIADSSNHVIRKITSEGFVTTLAGNGAAGYLEGAGTDAQFNFPRAIAIDTNGILYIADNGNHAIRKVTSEGIVTTLAGEGIAGYRNGNGMNSQFNYPVGLAVDGNGTIYVGDNGNRVIRKITPSGDVTTFAGNGTIGYIDGQEKESEYRTLNSLAIDGSGNLYATDTDNNAIRKIFSDGSFRTVAGNGTRGKVDGIGINARFEFPIALALDGSGNLYVADYGNGLLRYIILNP